MADLFDMAKNILLTSQKHYTDVRNGYGMSQINSCPRKLWYLQNNFPESPRDIDTEITFSIGRMMELWVINMLQLAGYNVTGEQHEVFYRGIRGHIDGFLFDGDKKYVLEIKTMSGYGFRELTNSDLQTANPDYYYQLQGYIAATGAAGGIIIVINKDSTKSDVDRIEYPDTITKLQIEWISPNIEALDKVIDRVYQATGGDRMPERPYDEPVKYPCTYCPFYDECWQGVAYVPKKRGKKAND